MNADRHQLDPAIATWLADGPVAATEETRRIISATIRQARQGHPIGTVQIARQSRLVAAAALLVALVALAVSVGGLWPLVPFESPSPAPGSLPPVLPSARVEVSASPNPTRGTATLDRPRRQITFTYELPAELGLRPREFGFVGVVGFVSTTLPVPSFPPADAVIEAFLEERGIAVADVTGNVEHGNYEPHPAFGKSAAEFLTGLDASDYFVVEDRERASIGDVPGWSARVTTEGEGPTHIDTGPGGGREGSVELGVPNVIFVADVGDAIVLVEIWAKTPEELADWLPRALPFVDSIRFEPE